MASCARALSSLGCSTSGSGLPVGASWRSQPGRPMAVPMNSAKKEAKRIAKALRNHARSLVRLAQGADGQLEHELARLASTLQAVDKHMARDLPTVSGPCSLPVVAAMSTLVAGSRSQQRPGPLLDFPAPPPIDFLEDQPAAPALKAYSSTGRVVVCQGAKCLAKGGLSVLQEASRLASSSPGIDVLPCRCLGKCKQGAALRVKSANGTTALYTQMAAERVAEVVDHHFDEQGMGWVRAESADSCKPTSPHVPSLLQ